MIIDILYLVIIAFAIFKGYSKGLVMAIFSFLGFIVGLAAALKLSNTVANTLTAQTSVGKWAPALAFFAVFIAVAFLVRLTGKFIEKTFEAVLLGWANKISGVLLFAFLYSVIFSVFIFYAVQLKLIGANTTAASNTYPFLKQLGPWVIDGIGIALPWFKEMFTTLESYFAKFAK
jgi:membrane protein required for colicin V production